MKLGVEQMTVLKNVSAEQSAEQGASNYLFHPLTIRLYVGGVGERFLPTRILPLPLKTIIIIYNNNNKVMIIYDYYDYDYYIYDYYDIIKK